MFKIGYILGGVGSGRVAYICLKGKGVYSRRGRF